MNSHTERINPLRTIPVEWTIEQEVFLPPFYRQPVMPLLASDAKYPMGPKQTMASPAARSTPLTSLNDPRHYMLQYAMASISAHLMYCKTTQSVKLMASLIPWIHDDEFCLPIGILWGKRLLLSLLENWSAATVNHRNLRIPCVYQMQI